ncbi:MAG: hypothetical protein JXB88_15460 [Spirochaetales bacterium]|nr:hypothetical protein [Spirochaetales bacterium]
MKGRIIKVKKGYNPNSSSIGSIIFTLPMTVITSGVCFGVISGIIYHYFMTKRKKEKGRKGNSEQEHQP